MKTLLNIADNGLAISRLSLGLYRILLNFSWFYCSVVVKAGIISLFKFFIIWKTIFKINISKLNNVSFIGINGTMVFNCRIIQSCTQDHYYEMSVA